MRGAAVAPVAALALAAGGARGEVTSSGEGGFQVRSSVEVAAPPKRVWAALSRPDRWWEPAHSYSGDPGKHMTIDMQAGGCFCESLSNGGQVAHMRVVHVDPNKRLGLSGALGPLASEGAAGGMVFALEPKGAGTTLTLTYTVGGYSARGIKTWAGPVDMVLGTQVARLKRYVETGSPASAKP